jgi:hypothetical protein
MDIEITLLEESLGSQPTNKEIHAEFIGSRSADAAKLEEEQAALPAEELVEKGMTVFFRHEGKPALMDYQIKGFFKDACGALMRVPGTESNKIKAYKKIIDGLIFVSPRFLPLLGAVIGNCQRPLRVSTPHGEQSCLANSETVQAGVTFKCEITCLYPRHEVLVTEWLNYGRLKGLGQWRNSGKGRFSWKKLG